MTLHVSLPDELENLVHQEVSKGMYGSASEVVREALRRFFRTDQDSLSADEVRIIRQEISRRTQMLARGEDSFRDADAYFDALEQRLSQ